MLKSLHLKNVGPAPEMSMELGSRLNIITGDNGLGKSFLLDVAWRVLTRKFPQEVNANLASGYPSKPSAPNAQIQYCVGSHRPDQRPDETSSLTYKVAEQIWSSTEDSDGCSTLVMYALADGGFAIWDPYRNPWRYTNDGLMLNYVPPPAFVFLSKEVWNGLDVEFPPGKHTRVCNGLLADWASWIREKGDDAQRMAAVLHKIAQVEDQTLEPGPTFSRLSAFDARDIPNVRMNYNQDVPILHASHGIRRMSALAYMLCWAWREHRIAASQTGREPIPQIVLLFDEVEAHLHPKWQRAIIPALLEVTKTLTDDDAATVQLIAATHSPLVLASLEPVFDTTQDKLFTLDLANGQVELREEPWAKQGDVINWLVSGSFGLRQGRSIEAELAIEAAEAWMRGDTNALPAQLSSKEAIHKELLRVLAGHDPFWPRWVVTAEVVS